MAEVITAPGRDWLTVIRRRGWIVAQVAVVCLLASIVAGRLQQELYQTYSEVMLYQQPEVPRGESTTLQPIAPSIDPKLQIRMVTSPEMITAIAEACGLPQTDQAKARLAQQISPRVTEESKNATVARIIVTHPSPTECADIASAAAKLFVESLQNDAEQSTKEGLQYVVGLVKNAERELKLTEEAIENFKKGGPPATYGDDAGAGSRLGNYTGTEAELAQVRVEIATTQRQLAEVKAKLKSEPKTRQQTTSVRNPFGEEIRKRIMDLSRQRRELLQEYTPQSFEVQSIDKQIEELQQDLKQEDERITESVVEQPNNIYEALRTEEVTLDGKLASLRGREAALTHLLRQRGAEVVELPSDQTELTRLLRHLRVQEQIYTVFLQRQYEMELESKLRQPKVAEVSREPVVPIVPFSPNRKLYAVIGLGAGILLGLIIAGLVDQLDDTFGDALEIERYVQAPSLGAVPIAPDALLPLPVIAAPTSRFSEAIRAAVVAMQAIWGESAPHRLLVITSPQGNEGVSLVTANVAAAFAETGRSVILVDGNMRQPSLHAAFGVSRESGLADAMSAGGAVAEYLRPTTMPGLRLLTAGTETPNPGALLGSERAKQTWEELRSLADLVIIDTPPVAGLPDVAMIASVADAAVLVLEHSSKRHATQEAAILLRRAGTRVLGCVRNRARGPRETVTIEMPTAA